MTSPHLTVVGNPDNRRVGLFLAAARAAELPEPRVIAWRDVARGEPVEFEPGSLVRIDSPGEDADVDALLRGAGSPGGGSRGGGSAAQPGEIIGLKAWYDGFAGALGRVAAAAADCGARLLADPREILVMFDKPACHARLAAAGVSVPAALTGHHGGTPEGSVPEAISSYDVLRAALREVGWSRVFVKPAYGSSASGVLALRRAGGRILATTSVELERSGRGVRLFNSLRVRDYHNERDISSIVDKLAPDGLHVERWYPKASLHGRVVDLRAVVIAGRPSHLVVRAGRGPMTNLHLGAARGDLAGLRSAAGEGTFAAAMTTCAAVARCFPGSAQVGVDLMFRSDWGGHAVAEVNAFGDLLPGLLVNGRDTYAEQIAALPTSAVGHAGGTAVGHAGGTAQSGPRVSLLAGTGARAEAESYA